MIMSTHKEPCPWHPFRPFWLVTTVVARHFKFNCMMTCFGPCTVCTVRFKTAPLIYYKKGVYSRAVDTALQDPCIDVHNGLPSSNCTQIVQIVSNGRSHLISNLKFVLSPRWSEFLFKSMNGLLCFSRFPFP